MRWKFDERSMTLKLMDLYLLPGDIKSKKSVAWNYNT